jgi:hypothetical protein
MGIGGTKGWTSDLGWGCMLRTSQSFVGDGVGQGWGCVFSSSFLIFSSCLLLSDSYLQSFLPLVLSSPPPLYFHSPLLSSSSLRSVASPRLGAPAPTCHFLFRNTSHFFLSRVLHNGCSWPLALPRGGLWMVWEVRPEGVYDMEGFGFIF